MNAERDRDDLKKASDDALKAEIERRTEKEWERRGDELEKKIDSTMNRLPKPVNSLLDALCITAVILGGAWIVAWLDWIDGIPSWRAFAAICIVVFVLSLAYRIFLKGKCDGCRR